MGGENMFGWTLRKKPPIVGLAIAVSILITLLAYTFVSCPLDDLFLLLVWLVVDLIVFGLAYFVMSVDVPWLEFFKMPKFQRNISLIIVAIAIVIAFELLIIALDILTYGALVHLDLALIVCALFYTLASVESAQKAALSATA